MEAYAPPPENSYKIARLEYIFDKISAFAKYSWGMHSRETLFKWCNLVCLEYNYLLIYCQPKFPYPPKQIHNLCEKTSHLENVSTTLKENSTTMKKPQPPPLELTSLKKPQALPT